MINKRELLSEKAGMSYFQILTLVIASFATAYVIYESSGLIAQADEAMKEINDLQKQGKLTKSILESIQKKLTEPLFPVVSASEPVLACCERTKTGGLCQDVLTANDCQSGFRTGSKCEQTSTCKLGCCVNTFEGTFDKNVPQTLCATGNNVTWYDNKNCNVPGANFGCCILGQSTQFVTSQKCERLAMQMGVAKNYSANLNEAQCVFASQIQESGACVSSSGGVKSCKFLSRQECAAATGSAQGFFANYLCTAVDLNTTCKPTGKTTCLVGKDEVYFIDSCGNRANVYDSSKTNDTTYWNKVLLRNETCNPNSGNADSTTCGNCNRYLGGICASANTSAARPQSGDFYCKDTSCTFEGTKYQSGESWCVYDGKIGDGDDVVGSRHWKYVCNQGDVQVEPCADYRNQICVQANVPNANVGGGNFRNANCIANNGKNCLALNSGGKISECGDTLNCELFKVDLGKGFQFDMCTPIYPPGFQLTNEDEQKAAEAMCSMATQTCTKVFKQTFFGGCECVSGCQCDKPIFTQTMNELCRKLGDCGAEANIVGEVTENYEVIKAPRGVDTEMLAGLADPVPGQYAEMEDYSKYTQSAGLLGPNNNGDGSGSGGSSSSSNLGMYGGAAMLGVGGIASAIGIGSIMSAGLPGLGFSGAASLFFTGTATVAAPVAATATTAATTGAITYTAASSGAITASTPLAGGVGIAGLPAPATTGLGAALPSFSAFAGAAIGAGIGMIVGMMLAKLTGASPFGSLVAALGGAVAGGVIGYSLITAGSLCATIVLCVVLIVAIIVMIIGLLLGGKKCKPIKITFTCQPWQPPSGSGDCDKCNDNPLKPCSEYRCNSLGSACELVNKGTDHEMCDAADKNDVSPPTISPNTNGISGGRYSGISSNGFRIEGLNSQCVDAYTNLIWGVTTSELAQCKYDLQSGTNWEDMYALGGNYYSKNHTTSFMLPDPSHGQSQGINWTGNLSFYIKCRDRQGNVNSGYYKVDTCVNQGPDKMAPRITATNPESNGVVMYNITSKNVTFYTNEVAECRWGKNDSEFGLMQNNMSCNEDIEEMNVYGYACNTTLPINGSSNTYYVRCMDQPWLRGINDSDRNANVQSYVYTLTKPEYKLNISAITPSGDFEVGVSPTTLTLKVLTSGGAPYPKCEYSFTGYNDTIDFFNTYADEHSQEFNLIPGSYRIYVQCSDSTGEVVQKDTSFKIIYDTNPPLIARVYRQGTVIKVITTETADCRYNSQDSIGCGFNFINGTVTGIGTQHTIIISGRNRYYLKCKDQFNNVPDSCSAIISSVQ